MLFRSSLEGLGANFCKAFVDSHSDPLDTGTLGVIRLKQIDALTAALAGFMINATSLGKASFTARYGRP